MGNPGPMQADHQADPHQEEHDQYERPLESNTTYDNAVNEDPPAQYPPPQQNVNIPGRSYPPQAQPQPQPQMYPPPQQQQQHQAHQGPVQFPPTRPPPTVPMSPSPLNQQQFINGSTTQGSVSSHIPNVNGTKSWSTGLFDCMEDPNNAFITAVFPCLTFGQIAEIIDNGHTTCGTSGIMYGAIAIFIFMPCLLSCTYRTKLRNQYDLVEAPGPDWAIHFLFEWCALCQAYRELKNRGLDPSIGWQGNQMRKPQQPVMMAPMNQTMMQ